MSAPKSKPQLVVVPEYVKYESSQFQAGYLAGRGDALAERGASEGWQPIESAPKDRTILLGYFNPLGNWRTLRGTWVTQDEIDTEWEDGDGCLEGWYETSVEADDVPSCWPTSPTHWQPLPAPLAAAQNMKVAP